MVLIQNMIVCPVPLGLVSNNQFDISFYVCTHIIYFMEPEVNLS